MNKSVSIITDLDGSKIALINDIRFKSRKWIEWSENACKMCYRWKALSL